MTDTATGMLLFDLAVIVLLARAMGTAARRLGQPAVIGEVVAGIALGPAVLGTTGARLVFPPAVRPELAAVADIGLAVFMFMVGLEFDRNAIQGSRKVVLSVSLGSTVVPFLMGAALADLLVSHDPSHHKLAFAVFVGAAMSITSFPVLARVLSDLSLHRVPLGALALTSAAVNNVIAWAILAVAMTIAGSGDLRLVMLVPLYAVLMIGVIRPLLRRLVRARPSARELVPVMVAGLLVSGAVTEWLGLHFIFGAYLFGAIVPAQGTAQLRRDLRDQLDRLCGLLLPVFFVMAGLQVSLTGVGWAGLGELVMILVVAITGKYAGAFGASRLVGTDVRRSAALATLMNTRGLTELIVLSVGLQLGLLDRQLYSYMVVMTLVTTAMVGPLMRLIYPRPYIERDLAEVALPPRPRQDLDKPRPSGPGASARDDRWAAQDKRG